MPPENSLKQQDHKRVCPRCKYICGASEKYCPNCGQFLENESDTHDNLMPFDVKGSDVNRNLDEMNTNFPGVSKMLDHHDTVTSKSSTEISSVQGDDFGSLWHLFWSSLKKSGPYFALLMLFSVGCLLIVCGVTWLLILLVS
jgi:hypothetical protein